MARWKKEEEAWNGNATETENRQKPLLTSRNGRGENSGREIQRDDAGGDPGEYIDTDRYTAIYSRKEQTEGESTWRLPQRIWPTW